MILKRVNAMKKRIASIDIAKAIGIFLIVLGHVLKSGNVRKVIFSFHVPLFFFLSGLCFSRKKNKEFIKKKLITTYVPYLILSLISIFIYTILGKYIDKEIETNFLGNICGMFYANSNLFNMEWNQPLWFLPSLMILLITINCIENIIGKSKEKNFIRLLISVIAFIVGIELVKHKLFLPFQFESSLCMMIWTYIGIICKEKVCIHNLKQEDYRKKIGIVVMSLIAIVGCVCLLLNNETISVRQGNYGNIFIYYFVSTIMISFVMLVSRFIEKTLKRIEILLYVGKNTLGILLLHKFPILFFQKIVKPSKLILAGKENITQIIVAIVISIITIGLCLLAQAILLKLKKRIDNKYDTSR